MPIRLILCTAGVWHWEIRTPTDHGGLGGVERVNAERNPSTVRAGNSRRPLIAGYETVVIHPLEMKRTGWKSSWPRGQKVWKSMLYPIIFRLEIKRLMWEKMTNRRRSESWQGEGLVSQPGAKQGKSEFFRALNRTCKRKSNYFLNME